MTSSGRCAQNAPARLSLSLSLFPIRVSLYIHLNPRDPTRKQDIHGNREREREREIEIDGGEKERKGGHCYLQHKPALASVGDMGALVSSVQRGEGEGKRESEEEEEEEEVKWTCYEIIEGDGERDDGGE